MKPTHGFWTLLGLLALALAIGCEPAKTTTPVKTPAGVKTPADGKTLAPENKTDAKTPEATTLPAKTEKTEAAPVKTEPAPAKTEKTEAAPMKTEAAPVKTANMPVAEPPKDAAPVVPAKPEAKTAEKPSEPVKPEAKTEAKTEAKPVAFEVKVPLGLPKLPIPADNPMTAEKVELGRMLYFDTRMSKDGTVSCATCHDPKVAWTENRPTSTGINKQVGGRNSPTVINAAYAKSMFWDGRAKDLEAQATGPVENPIEMGHSMVAVVKQLSEIPEYQQRFQKVFGGPVTKENFAKAIAAFERTILSGNSPYDRFKAGDKTALNEAQQRGLELFEKVGCADCHAPPLFSDYDFHNAGAGADKPKPDIGRREVTKKEEDTGAFRVPSLRDVSEAGPYFHDGSVAKLEDAVALMAAGGKDNPHRSKDFDTVREHKLTPDQQKDLVEFLKALKGEFPVVDPPQLP